MLQQYRCSRKEVKIKKSGHQLLDYTAVVVSGGWAGRGSVQRRQRGTCTGRLRITTTTTRQTVNSYKSHKNILLVEANVYLFLTVFPCLVKHLGGQSNMLLDDDVSSKRVSVTAGKSYGRPLSRNKLSFRLAEQLLLRKSAEACR